MKINILLLVMVVIVSLFCTVHAATLNKWELSEFDDYDGGVFHNASLYIDGHMETGRVWENRAGKVENIFSLIATSNNEMLFGSTGSIYRFYEGKQQKIFESKDLAITDFIKLKDNFYAASIPFGNIYKISDKYEVVKLCTLPDGYVWALTEGFGGNLIAATGPNGRLYEISSNGEAKEIFKAASTNIISVAKGGDGNLFFGTYPLGLLYKMDKNKKVSIQHEFDENEIKSILIDGETVFVVANKYQLEAEVSKSGSQDNEIKKSEADAPTPKSTMPVGAAVYRFDENGHAKKVFFTKDEFLTTIVKGDGGKIYLGSGPAANLYEISLAPKSYALSVSLDQKNLFVVAGGRPSELIMFTQSYGDIYVSEKLYQKDSHSYTSKILDGKSMSKWGNFKWQGKGSISIQTRSGNIPKVDNTWSVWSKPKTANVFEIEDAPSKYLQFKINFISQGAQVKDVEVYFLPNNENPVLSYINIVDGYNVDKTGPYNENIKKEYNDEILSVTVAPRYNKVVSHSDYKKIIWDAVDPDGDQLVYRLYYKTENSDDWIELKNAQSIKEQSFIWDVKGLPNGRYLLKIIASDILNNEKGKEGTSTLVSAKFLIDNIKPQIISFNREDYSGTCRDDLSDVIRLEYSINNEEYFYIQPLDGIAGSKEEKFRIPVDKEKANISSLSVRCYDSQWNMVVENFQLK